MDRSIHMNTPADAPRNAAAAATTAPPPDDFLSRLVKLVPSEIIAEFLLLDTSLQEIEEVSTRRYVSWSVIAILTILTFFYLKVLSKVTNLLQLCVSSLAFAVWALATSRAGLTSEIDPAIVTVGVIIFTMALPLVVRSEK